MVRIHLYSKEDCHLCDEAKIVIEKIQQQIPFELIVTKIFEGHPKFERFKEKIPVIYIDGEQSFLYRVDEKEFVKKIREAEEIHTPKFN